MSLEVHGLQFGYGRPLHAPLDLRILHGEILAVLGPSGCGKSTLLSTVAGLLPPIAGRIVLDGQDVTGVPSQRRGIGLMFQEPLLFTQLDVTDNVAYGLRRKGMPRKAARQRATELLEWVGLAGMGAMSPTALSGGQAQRVALARALAPAPRAMLLDEPFSALDADLRSRLAAEVSTLLREGATPTVYVTHDEAEAAAIGSQVLRLDGAGGEAAG